MRRASAITIALVAGALLGCPGSSASNADGGTAGAVSYAQIKMVSSAPPSALPTPPERKTVCRAISVTGSVRHDSDAGLAPSDIMGDDFVTLAIGSKLAVKNGTTTRETIFEGPGAVRTCIGGAEEMWMDSGTFKSVIGAGETLGAEVWLVLPEGVIRYGSGAQLLVSVTPSKADIKLTNGGAFAYEIGGGTMHDAGADGWYSVPLGVPVTMTSKQSAGQTVGECEQAAKAARDLAIAIGTHDASLAEAAPQHVVLRQKAHALCAVAELVASRSLDLVERERLLPRARMASAKWRDASP